MSNPNPFGNNNNNNVSKENLVNIYKFPTHAEQPPEGKNEIVIDNLYSNVIKFVHDLLRLGVITINPNLHKTTYGQTAEDLFTQFVNICLKEHGKQIELRDHALMIKPIDEKSVTQFEIGFFDIFLNNMVVNDNPSRVILLGNELAGSNGNDYWMLKLIAELDSQGLPMEILISQHSMEFMQALDNVQDENNETTKLKTTYLDPKNAKSLYNLQELIDDNLVTIDEIADIFNKHYKQLLRVVTYSQHSEDSITIHSHAPVGFDIIKSLYTCEGFDENNYNDDSIESLTSIINAINTKIQLCYLHYDSDSNNSGLSNHYDNKKITKAYQENTPSAESDPFIFSLLNQDKSDLNHNPNLNYTVNFLNCTEDSDALGATPDNFFGAPNIQVVKDSAQEKHVYKHQDKKEPVIKKPIVIKQPPIILPKLDIKPKMPSKNSSSNPNQKKYIKGQWNKKKANPPVNNKQHSQPIKQSLKNPPPPYSENNNETSPPANNNNQSYENNKAKFKTTIQKVKQQSQNKLSAVEQYKNLENEFLISQYNPAKKQLWFGSRRSDAALWNAFSKNDKETVKRSQQELATLISDNPFDATLLKPCKQSKLLSFHTGILEPTTDEGKKLDTARNTVANANFGSCFTCTG